MSVPPDQLWPTRTLGYGTADADTVLLGDGTWGIVPSGAIPGPLDANARVTIRKNTGSDVGTRRRINLIEGTNITMTIADDSGSEEVDVTITASGGSGAAVLYDSGEIGSDSVIDSGAGGFSTAYTTIIVLLQARDNTAVTAAAVSFRFNNDSGGNYDLQYVQVNNTTVTGAITAAATSLGCGVATGTSATADRYGVTEITIPNYASAANQKNGNFEAGSFNGGGSDAFVRHGQIQYRSTSAITRVATTNTLKAGSRMIILGL